MIEIGNRGAAPTNRCTNCRWGDRRTAPLEGPIVLEGDQLATVVIRDDFGATIAVDVADRHSRRGDHDLVTVRDRPELAAVASSDRAQDAAAIKSITLRPGAEDDVGDTIGIE